MTKASLLALFFLLTLGGCGSAGAPCQTACDCPVLEAPIRCPGEWGCNAGGRCEYSCKNTCDSGVSTCQADDSCNGSICSARTTCR